MDIQYEHLENDLPFASCWESSLLFVSAMIASPFSLEKLVSTNRHLCRYAKHLETFITVVSRSGCCCQSHRWRRRTCFFQILLNIIRQQNNMANWWEIHTVLRVSCVKTKITDVTIRTIGIFANNDIGVVDLPNYSHRREHDDLVGQTTWLELSTQKIIFQQLKGHVDVIETLKLTILIRYPLLRLIRVPRENDFTLGIQLQITNNSSSSFFTVDS